MVGGENVKSPLQKISGSVARIERKLGYHKQAFGRELAAISERLAVLEELFRRPGSK